MVENLVLGLLALRNHFGDIDQNIQLWHEGVQVLAYKEQMPKKLYKYLLSIGWTDTEEWAGLFYEIGI